MQVDLADRSLAARSTTSLLGNLLRWCHQNKTAARGRQRRRGEVIALIQRHDPNTCVMTSQGDSFITLAQSSNAAVADFAIIKLGCRTWWITNSIKTNDTSRLFCAWFLSSWYRIFLEKLIVVQSAKKYLPLRNPLSSSPCLQMYSIGPYSELVLYNAEPHRCFSEHVLKYCLPTWSHSKVSQAASSLSFSTNSGSAWSTSPKLNFINFLKKTFSKKNCYISQNTGTDTVRTCSFWDNIWCDECLTCWKEMHLLTLCNVISFITVRFDYFTMVTVKSRPFIVIHKFQAQWDFVKLQW
jgi:hypothetical protein